MKCVRFEKIAIQSVIIIINTLFSNSSGDEKRLFGNASLARAARGHSGFRRSRGAKLHRVLDITGRASQPALDAEQETGARRRTRTPSFSRARREQQVVLRNAGSGDLGYAGKVGAASVARAGRVGAHFDARVPPRAPAAMSDPETDRAHGASGSCASSAPRRDAQLPREERNRVGLGRGQRNDLGTARVSQEKCK